MVATKTRNEVQLLANQDRLIFSERKYPAYIGGIGSGKTMAGCLRALQKIQASEDGMILAPSYPMLRDSTQRTFFELLDRIGYVYDWNKSEGILKFNNCTTLFRSADIVQRLRGVNLNWAYIDEAALAKEEVWRIVLGRLRVGNGISAWITSTPAGFNWVYQRWHEQQNSNYELITASTRENYFLPSEYLEDLISNYSAEYARQEIDGDFVAFEGLVYSELSRALNVIKPFQMPDHWQFMRSIDYGYANPFVCLWGALDEDRRLYIYDEHYQRRTLIQDHAIAIKTREGKIAWTAADHDAQDNAEMAAQGIPTRNAQKDVRVGIQKVKARLMKQKDNRPRLFIFENCVNLLKEFSMYRWAEKKTGRNELEEPVKEADHGMDALRYMVMEIDGGRFILV